MRLDVPRTRLSGIGVRTFPVAAARLWNSLSSHIPILLPLSPSSIVVIKIPADRTSVRPSNWLWMDAQTAARLIGGGDWKRLRTLRVQSCSVPSTCLFLFTVAYVWCLGCGLSTFCQTNVWWWWWWWWIGSACYCWRAWRYPGMGSSRTVFELGQLKDKWRLGF